MSIQLCAEAIARIQRNRQQQPTYKERVHHGSREERHLGRETCLYRRRGSLRSYPVLVAPMATTIVEGNPASYKTYTNMKFATDGDQTPITRKRDKAEGGAVSSLVPDVNRKGWSPPRAKDESEAVRLTLERLEAIRAEWLMKRDLCKQYGVIQDSPHPKKMPRPPRAGELAFDLTPSKKLSIHLPDNDDLGDVVIPWSTGNSGERIRHERLSKAAIKLLQGASDQRKANAIRRRLVTYQLTGVDK